MVGEEAGDCLPVCLLGGLWLADCSDHEVGEWSSRMEVNGPDWESEQIGHRDFLSKFLFTGEVGL